MVVEKARLVNWAGEKSLVGETRRGIISQTRFYCSLWKERWNDGENGAEWERKR